MWTLDTDELMLTALDWLVGDGLRIGYLHDGIPSLIGSRSLRTAC